MRAGHIVDAIVFSDQEELTTLCTDILRQKGVSNVVEPNSRKNCQDALERFPKALLIVDWAQGPDVIVPILNENQKTSAGRMRPVLILASAMSEQLIAVAAEYSVTQVFSENLQDGKAAKNLASRLVSMMVVESIPADVKKVFKDIEAFKKKNQYSQAISALITSIEKHPDMLRLKADLAELYLQTDELDKAMAALSGVENSKPPYLRGLHLYGRCLMKANRQEDALKVLETAHLLNPHNVDRLVDIGHVLLQLDRVDDAKESFDAALSLQEDARSATIGKGQCLLMDNHVNDALSLLREISSDLEKASLFNTAAVLNMRHGRHEQGMSLYNAALKALKEDNRIHARLYFNMGIGYRRWGKNGKAATCFEQATRLDPNFEKARKNALIFAGSNVVATPEEAAVVHSMPVDGNATQSPAPQVTASQVTASKELGNKGPAKQAESTSYPQSAFSSFGDFDDDFAGLEEEDIEDLSKDDKETEHF